MSLKERAEAFLAQPRIAVVGVSSKGGNTGAGIFRGLRKRGLEVVPIHPEATEFDGQPCYPDVGSVPGGVNAAILVTRPEVTEQVVRQCAEAGVTHVWMHYNKLFGKRLSSVSADAVAFCRENGIEVIDGACPMMFGEGADFGHRAMCWILGVTGGLPAEASPGTAPPRPA